MASKFERVEESRISINSDIQGLTIVIPHRRSWVVIPFLSFWLIGWAIGEFTAFRMLMAIQKESRS